MSFGTVWYNKREKCVMFFNSKISPVLYSSIKFSLNLGKKNKRKEEMQRMYLFLIFFFTFWTTFCFLSVDCGSHSLDIAAHKLYHESWIRIILAQNFEMLSLADIQDEPWITCVENRCRSNNHRCGGVWNFWEYKKGCKKFDTTTFLK